MRLLCSLICFFSLQDALVSISVYTQTEGGYVSAECSFHIRGSWKWFCRDECEEENILIRAAGVTARKGRYSIKYEESREGGKISVNVIQLTKADSGLYTCALIGSLTVTQQFKIIVVDAMLLGNAPEVKTLYAISGGNIVVECAFARSEIWKFFCRDDCQADDLLIETTSAKKEKQSRYTLEYLKGFATQGFLLVSISQLTTSDSGRYRCGMGRLRSQVHREFRVVVKDASTPTTTQTFNSEFDLQSETTPPEASHSDVCLSVGLTLAALLILLLPAVIVYRKRSQAKEPPVEAEYASVTEANRASKNIGEDMLHRSPPVEASYTEYSRPHGTGADRSSVTADASEMTVAADWTSLTYSEVKFSHHGTAVRGAADAVVYSEPWTEVDSDPPVYSSIT